MTITILDKYRFRPINGNTCYEMLVRTNSEIPPEGSYEPSEAKRWKSTGKYPTNLSSGLRMAIDASLIESDTKDLKSLLSELQRLYKNADTLGVEIEGKK